MTVDWAVELQRIYDNEINVCIDWFWDGGIHVGIGDDDNGWADHAYFGNDTEAALLWLRRRVCELFPMSDYVRGCRSEIPTAHP